jgi:hypothetical protein
MWTADDVYGPLPTAVAQVTPTVAPTGVRASTPMARAGQGEPLGGDPVLVWVLLLGVAIALGWVSVTGSIKVG